MDEPKFKPLSGYRSFPDEEMVARAAAFYESIRLRRSVRNFSSRPVPKEVIESCLKAAGTSPSGANQQPWRFVVVRDPEIKNQIRVAAEKEEQAFYEEKAPADWLQALAPLGTGWEKPFLDSAPYLIAIFSVRYGLRADGSRQKHYYIQESVGIATGILITALHQAGLATLTHTPSPMRFLNTILDRPVNERPFLLLVVGHPAADASVPVIRKKPLADIAIFR